MKDATARDATDGIAANCDDILAFLQAVALKALRVQAAPLSLRADKHMAGWFCQWTDSKLKHQIPPTSLHPKINQDSWEYSVKLKRVYKM